jgi:hypothetical protein
MSMDLLKRTLVTTGLALVPAAAGGVCLSRLGASPGWYYGLALVLTGLVVWRSLFPTVGLPRSFDSPRRKRPGADASA